MTAARRIMDKTKQKKHGTRGAYVMGCRCRACVDANNARAWAYRYAAGWRNPILTPLGRIVSAKTEDGVYVPREVIALAVEKCAPAIRLAALELVRTKEHEETKNG